MNLIYLNYTLCELAYQTHEEHLFEREWYINADSIKYVEIEDNQLNFIFKDGKIEKFYKDDLRGDKDKYLKNYAEVIEILKLNKLKIKE